MLYTAYDGKIICAETFKKFDFHTCGYAILGGSFWCAWTDPVKLASLLPKLPPLCLVCTTKVFSALKSCLLETS